MTRFRLGSQPKTSLPTALPEGICGLCERSFIRTKNTKRFCSEKCRALCWRQQNKAYCAISDHNKRQRKPEIYRAIRRKWKSANREKVNTSTRALYWKNPDRYKAYQREHYQRHKKRLREINKKRANIRRKNHPFGIGSWAPPELIDRLKQLRALQKQMRAIG